MTDTDSDALLLDKIGGKYGDGSDYEDLGNADEDALLADDELLDQEPEDPDTLDLEAPDVELDELDDKNVLMQSVTSTTVSESDLSARNTSEVEDKEREDRFKSERETPSSKLHNIPDSLDNVQIVSSLPTGRNGKRGMGSFKNRGRGGSYAHRNSQNQTVLINPHFKGHVKINNNARLAWDARQKINNNNNQQVGRIRPFLQNRNQNHNNNNFQPWMHNNRPSGVSSNIPNFQPQPPQIPVYQPPIQQPQVPVWNQYQPNSFNEGPPQMGMNNNQLMIMQPIPQNVYGNQQMQPQFNLPPSQFGPPPYTPPPLYSNPVQNQGFSNNQFLPPPNQFRQAEPVYSPFPQTQPNQYMQNSRNPQYNQMNEFNNNRVIRAKQFAHLAKNNKRKVENAEARKKKRTLTSTNLHEVHTIETPDTTVKEDKVDEEEDEYTRQYRLNIEEQKRKREKILKLKEERRLKAIQDSESGNTNEEVVKMSIPVQQNKPSFKQQQQSNLKEIRLVSKPANVPVRTQQTIALSQTFNNSINTNTNPNDDSSYDKQHLASFLSNRKILTKDQSLIDTSIVVISNLSAGTTNVKLRKMCQGIGDIKKLQMSPKERQATIQFNSVASAHAFFKKYQRTMLDLSMIQVTLKPMS